MRGNHEPGNHEPGVRFDYQPTPRLRRAGRARTVVWEWRRAKMLAIGGMPNHVHVLTGMPPSLAGATMVRDIKARSSALVNEIGLTDIPTDELITLLQLNEIPFDPKYLD